jgi:hypothetical protein
MENRSPPRAWCIEARYPADGAAYLARRIQCHPVSDQDSDRSFGALWYNGHEFPPASPVRTDSPSASAGTSASSNPGKEDAQTTVSISSARPDANALGIVMPPSQPCSAAVIKIRLSVSLDQLLSRTKHQSNKEEVKDG